MGSQIEKNGVSRRSFLAASGVAALGAAGLDLVREAEAGNALKKRFRVIDTHQHVRNTSAEVPGGLPRGTENGSIGFLIRAMDQGGVDKGFLISYNAEDVQSLKRTAGYSPIHLRLLYNKEYHVQSWEAHKDRFWWFTDGVNPVHEDYLEVLERDFERGASGVKLMPILHGLLPDHPAWHPVYELCRKHRKPVILDESWWYLGRVPIFNETRERRNLVKFQSFADYARILEPLFEEFSDVPISLAHCGAARTWDDHEEIFSLIARRPNLSCDVAYVSARMSDRREDRDYPPSFIQRLVKAVGARKIMYGADGPGWFKKGVNNYRTGRNRWTIIGEECTFLSDEEKQLILAGNAERFARNELPESS